MVVVVAANFIIQVNRIFDRQGEIFTFRAFFPSFSIFLSKHVDLHRLLILLLLLPFFRYLNLATWNTSYPQTGHPPLTPSPPPQPRSPIRFGATERRRQAHFTPFHPYFFSERYFVNCVQEGRRGGSRSRKRSARRKAARLRQTRTIYPICPKMFAPLSATPPLPTNRVPPSLRELRLSLLLYPMASWSLPVMTHV